MQLKLCIQKAYCTAGKKTQRLSMFTTNFDNIEEGRKVVDSTCYMLVINVVYLNQRGMKNVKYHV